jgi:uncharacterized membrane protein YgcG
MDALLPLAIAIVVASLFASVVVFRSARERQRTRQWLGQDGSAWFPFFLGGNDAGSAHNSPSEPPPHHDAGSHSHGGDFGGHHSSGFDGGGGHH